MSLIVSALSRIPVPVPIPDLDSVPFWEGCRRGQLLLQRCSSCQAYRYPPRPICPHCHARGGEWVPTSGRGTVYSWVVAHHPPRPEFAEHVPYTIIIVKLLEGVHMVSRLVDASPDEVREGMPVEVAFQPLSDEITLPNFRPAGGVEPISRKERS